MLCPTPSGLWPPPPVRGAKESSARNDEWELPKHLLIKGVFTIDFERDILWVDGENFFACFVTGAEIEIVDSLFF